MNNKMRRGFAAMLVAGAMSLLAAPLTAQASTVNVSVNCDGQQHSRYVAEADTVVFTLTNCTDWVQYDNDWNSQDSGAVSGSTYSGTTRHSYEFYNSDDRAHHFYYINLWGPEAEHVPAGQLLLTKDLTIGTSPSQMNVGAANQDIEHILANNPQCGLQVSAGQNHVYSKVDLHVSKAGEYTFRGIGSTPGGHYLNGDDPSSALEDPMVALYKGFDPAHPDRNVIGCNDDLNDQFDYNNNEFVEELSNGVLMEGHQPYFIATLQPGNYTLLLLTWNSMSASQWAAGDNGDGLTFTPGAETTTVQMWGPSGGLTEGSVNTLANTGSVVDSTWAMVAALMMLAGAGVLATRRTKKN